MIDTQTMVDFPVFADSGQHIKPADAKYSGGFLPADTLPAQYANWLWYKTSKAVTELNKGVESIEEELNSILTAAGITPSEATNDQVKTAVLQWIADAKNLTNATNTLAVSHGGTGATTAKAAQKELLSNMNSVTTDPVDTSQFVMAYASPTASTGAVFKITAAKVWNWIKSKIAGITDSTPTASSNNLITSGGTKTALDTKPDKPNFVTLAQYNAKTSAERAGKYWIITDATGVDVPLIQDDTKSTTTVWSSTKTDNQINGALANYDKVAQQIADNTSLNNIRTQGWYFVKDDTSAKTISDKPSGVNVSFGLRVIKTKQDASGNVTQLLFTVNNGEFFTRTTSAGTTWNDWEKVITTTSLNGALADYPKKVATAKLNAGSLTFTGNVKHQYMIFISHPYANTGIYSYFCHANGTYTVKTTIAVTTTTQPTFTINKNTLTITSDNKIDIFDYGEYTA